MSLPPGLIAAALVGASRAEFPDPGAFPPALGDVLSTLASRPFEERLLLLSGATALHYAAGHLPDRAAGTDWRLPAYRPEGERPVCSPAAAYFLERMLSQQDANLFPELLRLLANAGLRAPDALVPHILERGAKVPRLRPLLVPIIGERGRWLGAINPAWRYAAVDPAEPKSQQAAWEADPSGRAALATIIRAHDPPAARRLIESTWRSEPEAVRRELLAVLESRLSMDDEPFLERALDDRDVLVRRRAAELLAGIPTSRLVGRITAAAGGILELKAGRLSPHFPGRITDAMVRDGITRRDDAPRRDTGSTPLASARSYNPLSATDWSRLLIQTVGVIPLGHWTDRFGVEPEPVIRAALAGKWPRTIITSLATAARRQYDRQWIDALLRGDGYSERTGMLLQALAPGECYALLAERITAGDDDAVLVFLRRWLGPWDEASAANLIDFFGRKSEIDPDNKESPTLRFLTRQFAQQCPPSLAGYAAENFGQRRTNKAWDASLRALVVTLNVRADMQRAVFGR